MDLNLQPLATACHVTGEPFADGVRVASFLVSTPGSADIARFDLLESAASQFQAPGPVICRWVQPFKPRKAGENADRTLKLTAESLFLTLADPTTEPTEESTRLLQFLALMLERKKILRPKGLTADGARQRLEHARSKQMFEIPAAELSPEFFVQVQEQLSVLVGPKKSAEPRPTEAPPEAPAESSPAPQA
ncbi:hypothetical protein GALL_142410 [mine drainage metagenome]|uniref:Uncharacterized protein n=1 Tax=mine drainage metagenome TaxID=410659 RepID=A0A1J5S6R7_9ZZZZ